MYFDGSFDAYEEQMQGEEFRRRYNDFTKKYGERLATFDKSYADYRIFTKKYENPDEDTYDRIYQVAGEIVMLDTIMFSLSLQKGSNYEKDIVNASAQRQTVPRGTQAFRNFTERTNNNYMEKVMRQYRERL